MTEAERSGYFINLTGFTYMFLINKGAKVSYCRGVVNENRVYFAY